MVGQVIGHRRVKKLERSIDGLRLSRKGLPKRWRLPFERIRQFDSLVPAERDVYSSYPKDSTYLETGVDKLNPFSA
jgi:hypothetical protein